MRYSLSSYSVRMPNRPACSAQSRKGLPERCWYPSPLQRHAQLCKGPRRNITVSSSLKAAKEYLVLAAGSFSVRFLNILHVKETFYTQDGFSCWFLPPCRVGFSNWDSASRSTTGTRVFLHAVTFSVQSFYVGSFYCRFSHSSVRSDHSRISKGIVQETDLW